jgi:hypothetical protein
MHACRNITTQIDPMLTKIEEIDPMLTKIEEIDPMLTKIEEIDPMLTKIHIEIVSHNLSKATKEYRLQIFKSVHV